MLGRLPGQGVVMKYKKHRPSFKKPTGKKEKYLCIAAYLSGVGAVIKIPMRYSGGIKNGGHCFDCGRK